MFTHMQISTMTTQDVQAALQSHMVYIIMRIVAGVSGDPEWNHEMTEALAVRLSLCDNLATACLQLQVLCEHFLRRCDGLFAETEIASPSLTWEDWVFAESRRRSVHCGSAKGFRV